MKKNRTLIVTGILLCLLALGVGYAAISGISLQITGTASASSSDSNFVVEFTGTPSATNKSTGVTASGTIDSSDKHVGTITVSGLSSKNDYAEVVYTITNKSTDLYANLSKTTCTVSDTTYFSATCSLGKTQLAPNSGTADTTTLTVKITLLKPVVDSKNANVTVTYGAAAAESAS